MMINKNPQRVFMNPATIDKRGAGIAINRMVILILVLFAVAVGLMFLFKFDPLKYFINLPDYDYPEGDEPVDLTNFTDEQIESLCPFRIGHIQERKISFCGNFGTTCDSLIESKLEWDGDEKKAEIEVSQSFWGIDELNHNDEIGFVLNGRVSIFLEVLEELELYWELEEDLPNKKFLTNLDGSYYFSGNWICRKGIVEGGISIQDKFEFVEVE